MSGDRWRPVRRLAGPAASCLLLVATACTSAVPPPSTGSPLIVATGTGRPSASQRATVPPAGTAAEPAVVVETGIVAARPLELSSDGTTIVYTAAPDRSQHAAELWRTVPGGEPELVYRSADPATDIDIAAVHGDVIAFSEQNQALWGDQAWRLSIVPARGADPVEIDRAEPDEHSPFPIIAVSARHAVWQAFHRTPDGLRSQLLHVALPSLERSALFSEAPERYQWWYPDLDGDRLVFTQVDYVHGDASSAIQPASLHVQLLDLSRPGAAPETLDTSGRAVTPQIAGDWVAWKEADNVFAWGTLVVHQLSSGRSRTVDASPQGGINYPRLGNRFVAFWGLDDTKFWVYDLQAQRMARIFEIAPDAPTAGATRPDVTGDLLLWVQGTSGQPVAHWGLLPPLGSP